MNANRDFCAVLDRQIEAGQIQAGPAPDEALVRRAAASLKVDPKIYRATLAAMLADDAVVDMVRDLIIAIEGHHMMSAIRMAHDLDVRIEARIAQKLRQCPKTLQDVSAAEDSAATV